MTAPSEAASPQHLSSAVGFQFVRQYYTVLNKDPSKLHCFYKKPSLFTNGEEGQNPEPALGQVAINTAITNLDFQNCKVVVSQLDTQPSINDGVIIMVLGEMSNKGGPSRRFAQTFFLASEEPGRYFVQNDIFRFLKEAHPGNGIPAASPPQSFSQTIRSEIVSNETPAPAPIAEVAPEQVPAEKHVVQEPEEQIQTPIEATHEDAQYEHIEHDEIPPEAAEPPVTQPAPVAQSPSPVAQPANPAPVQSTPTPSAPAPTTQSSPPPSQSSSAPKVGTWANRAATDNPQKQWGNNVANVKAYTVEQPDTSKPERPEKSERSERPERSERSERSDRSERSERSDRSDRSERSERNDRYDGQQHNRRTHTYEPEHDVSVFLGNVQQEMRAELQKHFSQFGEVQNITFLSGKNSAFVDFRTPEEANKAIAADAVFIDGVEVKAEKRTKPRQNGSRGRSIPNGPRPGGRQDIPQGQSQGQGQSQSQQGQGQGQGQPERQRRTDGNYRRDDFRRSDEKRRENPPSNSNPGQSSFQKRPIQQPSPSRSK